MEDTLRIYSFYEEQQDGETKCYVSFKDGQGICQEAEVTAEIFEEMQNLMRKERNYIRSNERHLEQLELSEEMKHRRLYIMRSAWKSRYCLNFCKNDGDKLCDTCKNQISMECFFILCFSSSKTEMLLDMVDILLDSRPGFISVIPVFGCTKNTRISTKILFRMDISHSAT